MLLAESLLGSSSVAANYIEDAFSTYLYTGNGGTTNIPNGIRLNTGEGTSAGWLAKLSGANDIGRDSSDNVYVCSGTTLVKYNSSGVLQWQTNFANSGALVSVAVTGAGDAYVVGYQSSPVGFGIIKFNSSGVVQWQRTLTTFSTPVSTKIALDSSENAYISGSAASGGGFTLSYIAKYNSSGTLQWQKSVTVGSSTDDETRLSDIASDSSGNIYVCGNTKIFSTDTQYYVIQKYNTSGTLQWERKVTPASAVNVSWAGIALSSDGADVYVAGARSAPIRSYLVKYNSSGTIQWQRDLSAGSLKSVTVDSSNNVYAIGTGSDSAKTGVYKYNSSGTLQWQRDIQSNSAGSQSGQTIATTSTGDILISFNQTNGYFAKLPADGSGLGVYNLGADTSDTIAYVTSNLTTATPTQADSAGSLSSSTSSLTGATSSYTSSAGSLTSTTTALNQVSSASDSSGGLVWIKDRSGTNNHALYDTARGATLQLSSNLTNASSTESTGLTNFLPNGFTLGALSTVNASSTNYASWAFRKQPKFFDVVTYTGTGANRTIAHNLGSVPGCIMIKRTDTTAAWAVYHRSLANTQYMVLNTTAAAATGATYWNSTTPTSSVFSLGTNSAVNASGGTYVAYIFAHDVGGFGNAGADNVITCGSFTVDGSSNADVTLGYEPQWLLLKASNDVSDWDTYDIMRGLSQTSIASLVFNSSVAESSASGLYRFPTATGFGVRGLGNPSKTWVYVAIRRGPMKVPTTGTSVFGLSARTGTGANATVTGGQTDDAILVKNRGSAVGDLLSARLVGTGYMETSSTAAEVAASSTILQSPAWDVMDGVKLGTTSTITNANANTFINYLFRRAPGFFDVVCYTGTGGNSTVNHNLGVAPELMIVKIRAGATGSWPVYASSLGNNKYLLLNTTAASVTGAGGLWNNTSPTSSVFSVGSDGWVNNAGYTYVAYLFATVAGVSKVGSYTGTGTTLQIDCGFTAGARFVLIKRTDSTGAWYVWDSARGIVAGNDPYWLLNSTAAQVTSTDYVDTYSAGFEISSTAPAAINANGGSFIFLAIA